MQTEPRQILLLLDSGQITLSEAEHLLDSAWRHSLLRRTSLGGLRRWISNRFGYAIAAALLTGMLLQPAVLFAAQRACGAVAGSETLQLFFHRLLEAIP